MKLTKKNLTLLLFLIYGQICFTLSLRSNIFSIIQTEYNLPFSHIATLVLISGIVMQISTYLTGILIKRSGYNKTLILGLVSLGVSVLFMIFAKTIFVFDFLFTVFMFGLGVSSLVLNMYTGFLSDNNSRGKTIMKLHVGAATGLCLGPTVMSKLLTLGMSWQIIISLSSIPIFIFIIILTVCNKTKDGVVSIHINKKCHNKNNLPYKSLIVWTFIVIFLCSQIWEYGMGTWFIIYAKHAQNLSETEASRYLTIFLVSFPIGRLLSSKILDYISYYQSILVAFAADFILILLGITTKQLIFISLTGLFTSLMYPITMSMMQEEFGESSSDLIGWICMIGGILQYIFIWTVGKIGDNFGITIGFSSLIIYILIGNIAVLLIKNLLSESKTAVESHS
ncbi:MFS transporter [Clostridium sp. MB40-C1]|uniref:MFS transporter n=1 Tax=Clostridium sp. MB40-C1 TaxID=3070996 RepID=UPI0027E1AAC8|nr:MFS transporter [Clostridium sp. MB40-C1]WMJ80487.1 MFS transporter [Clostridium sp. MB40-C1]